MSDNIKVVVKVRPLISREIEEKLSHNWRVGNNALYLDEYHGKDPQCFTFDKVYDEDAKTSEVYEDIAKPIVESAVAGINGTIFAYGQTSSGKTYTMTGTPESPGIIPLSVQDLFKIIESKDDRDFLLRVSYIEIYNDTIKDLLNAKNDNIKIRENIHNKGVRADATEKVVSTYEEVLALMKEGEDNRQIGATNMNEQSSRSHSIFQITIESREHVEEQKEAGCVNVSQLNLVDLAGSERAGQTGATGKRFKEGTHINKSLTSLALVIKQLSEAKEGNVQYVNYRDSKLTRILQNSLGGNAKTSIICAVTPATVEETISTLQFASRAKDIKNKPEVNAVATNATMIQKLTKQLSKLQLELMNKKDLEKDNRLLTEKIQKLRRQIINGFTQNPRDVLSNVNRRKTWCAPRRMTIDSVPLSVIDEDKTHQFATPLLKYNPLTMPSGSSLAQVRSEFKMSRLSEESSGKITPPPSDRKVYFDSEIIEIDSDEDDSVKEVCSPVHACYESKTPPCVLRHKVKNAEKNLKEIAELAEREKQYPPPISELLQKLDQNTDVVRKMEDQINELNKKCEDKESEMEEYKLKITDSEKLLQDKNDERTKLEETCKELNIKLTDLEVSYETLQRKAKLREEELLSLLEEQKQIQSRRNGKPFELKSVERDLSNFMDISKDISLVNSDNETDETPLADLHETVLIDQQKQLANKDKLIQQLESEIITFKNKIAILEKTNGAALNEVGDLKNKINDLETANLTLSTSNDTLQSLIKSNEDNLASANDDLKSYSQLVKELNSKIEQQTNLSVSIKVEMLNSLLEAEEQIITNNEDTNHIFNMLKNAIQTRNKEILDLKAQLQSENFDSNKIEFEQKVNELNNSSASKDSLKIDNVNLTLSLVNLETENKELQKRLEEVKNELQDALNNYNALEKKGNKCIQENYLKEIESLNILVTQLRENINTKDSDLYSMKTDLQKALQELCITTSEKDAFKMELDHLKSHLINLSKENTETKQSLDLINDELTKDIKTALDMSNKEPSDINEDYHEKRSVEICINTIAKRIHTLLTDLTGLETEIINDTNTELVDFIYNGIGKIEAKIKAMTKDTESPHKLSLINEKYEKLKQKVLEVTSAENESKKLYDELLKDHTEVTLKFMEITRELDSKIKENQELQHNVERLSTILQENERIIKKHIENESEMHAKIENQEFLYLEIDVLNKNIVQELDKLRNDNKSSLEVFDKTLKNKDVLIATLNDRVKELESYLSKNNLEISERSENDMIKITSQNELLQSILDNIVNIIKTHNITVNIDLSDGIHMFLQIPSVLHDIESHINNLQNSDLESLLRSNNLEITHLNEQNSKLLKDLNNFHDKCLMYTNKITTIENHNKQLSLTLNECNDRIAKLTDEVKEKSFMLDSMQSKVIQLKAKASETCNLMKPDSLISICCNKVSETLLRSSSESTLTPCSSKTQLGPLKVPTKEIGCQCETLNSELVKYQEATDGLERKLEFFQMANKKLIEEQGLVREEIKLLFGPSVELHKKLATHKTHLSSLTATTYAETQLLKSQVKHLEHHHERFYNSCQRAIPDFKTQLNNLHDLLKSEYLYPHNYSYKRYSLPTFLDCNNSQDTLRNDSTLDGDMLMLETNVTLATSTDTLTCLNQTCLDETQTFLENLEIPSNTQDSNTIELTKQTFENDSKISTTKFVEESTSEKAVDLSQIIKIDDDNDDHQLSEILAKYDILQGELNEAKAVKTELEERITKFSDQIKNSESLSIKIKSLEKEIIIKSAEIIRIQDENDQLSTEIMDNVTEVDNLKKEVNDLKEKNTDLKQKCTELEVLLKTTRLEGNTETSLFIRNSDNTRNTKFCTLQKELYASKEDCRKINEEVTTMKYQLERSNLSISQAMDIDDSMNESNIFTFTKDFETSQSQLLKSNTLHNIAEDKNSDNYALEKSDCFNYYFEITGADKENFNGEFKIIDVMKLLHNNVQIQHSNEVQNLTNKLLVLEGNRKERDSQITAITSKYSLACQELENNAKSISDVLKNSECLIRSMDSAVCDGDSNMKLVETFKENVLNLLDMQFALKTTNLFEALIDNIALKHQSEIRTIMDQYTQLQNHMEKVANELNTVNVNIQQIKMQLSKKEEEYNQLKAQKDKMQEINNAVAMDVNQREERLNDMIMQAYQKLIEHNIVIDEEFDFNESLTNNINKLLEKLINQSESLGHTSSEKEKIQQALSEELFKLKDENKQLSDAKNKQEQSLNDLNEKHEIVLQENTSKTEIIDKLHQQMAAYKMEMCEKIQQNSKEQLLTDMMVKIENMEAENNNLRSLNECLARENSDLTVELSKAADLIETNKVELENMTIRLSELNDSVNEKLSLIEALNSQCQALAKERELLNDDKKELTSKLNETQQQSDLTCQELARLKINIKTHEKTAEIQAKMISRLQKHNSEDAAKLKEKEKQLDEMSNKYTQLQLDLESMQNELKATKDSLSQLQQMKDSAEARVSELEAELTGSQRDRLSLDKVRRRRQSLIDSKRGFYDDKTNDDHNSLDAVFASRSNAKPDEMFMDVDDNGSNQSTPIMRRRDSILQQRGSDNSDDKAPSRPSSVSGTRRRRQSVHDKLRSSLTQAEALQDRLRGDNTNIKSADSSVSENELATLKERLQACQQDLEEYKERCRELDEECEMCAQCLHERDDVIAMLRKKNLAVEQSLAECKAALDRVNPELSRSIIKPSMVDAAVNTDADWANLRFFHSVVVDRMSFDAEVEKNKKLVKAIEDQRHKNHELKALVAQMQRALDKKPEDTTIARDLAEAKQELEELRVKYKEMDEEYETCAEYLREREQQCYTLKEAKAALEARLVELQEDVKEITKSTRKKRQSFHDQSRETGPSHIDASTETTEEYPHYSAQDIAFLNKKIEALAQEKLLLEQQIAYLSSRAQNPSVMYVATGSAIVQNQQITEIMKENEKLKRMNLKLAQLCHKRGKSHKLENNKTEEPQQG